MGMNTNNFDWLLDDRLRAVNKMPDMPNQFAERAQLEDEADHAVIDSLEVLKQIKMNTDYLKDLVSLLNANNDHQKELNVMVEGILSIAKAPTREESESRYRSVMKKIGDFALVASATVDVVKLTSLATMVLRMVGG